MIDFDRNATAPLRPEALAAMSDALAQPWANPASVHRAGQRARARLEQARRGIAAALDNGDGALVFTSGGTESDALAILGMARGLRAAGRSCGVACSAIEHPAVTESVAMLRREGFTCVALPIDRAGRLQPDAVAAAVAATPALGVVSFTAAHHELGNTVDVAAMTAAIRAAAPTVLIHVDAVQAAGKLPLSRLRWDVDALSISSHKLGGPVGIGALALAQHVPLLPLHGGGAQQRGRRPGTEPLVLAIGFDAAVQAAIVAAPREHAAMRASGQRLRAGLQALGAELVGDVEQHVGNTALVRWPGVDGHTLVIALDLAGFACSTGAACSTGVVEPSRVLRALGYDADAARGAVRLSLGPDHRDEHVDALLEALPPILARVRAATAAGQVAS